MVIAPRKLLISKSLVLGDTCRPLRICPYAVVTRTSCRGDARGRWRSSESAAMHTYWASEAWLYIWSSRRHDPIEARVDLGWKRSTRCSRLGQRWHLWHFVVQNVFFRTVQYTGKVKKEKKEIPYKEGNMKDIGSHYWYTVLIYIFALC